MRDETVERAGGRIGMPSLVEFARHLLEEGRVIHQGPPSPVPEEADEVTAVLERAFDDHSLDVAGPPIAFERGSALASLELVRRASWFLISRSEPPEVVEAALTMPKVPKTASEHLSGDVCLRFLPVLHRRSRSIAPGDPLPSLLARFLREWPLSGVLADLDEGPSDVGDLGGHPGLWMLYAERLAKAERPGWMPSGVGRDRVELVFEGLGMGRSPLLKRAVATDSEEGG